ncbi:MAG: right-handed parallel beta-helix repeat-containing protein [Methanococcoides sp.]|nr:right-handed parallel beta-helix repeat-containing protein [Methanococcoides sp.]
MISGTAAAGTFTVNNSIGPVADFSSIQAAVNAALDGDIILVYPGTYNENVDVNKQLNITSTDGSAATHVTSASSNDDVFEVTADEVTISGFHVSGASSNNGIHLHEIENCIVINNKVSNNSFGIRLFRSSNNTLTNNTVSNNTGIGIYMSSSSNDTLTNNTVSNNAYEGIWLSSSSDSTLISNTVTNNNYGIFMRSSSDSTLISNTASNNNYGIVLSESSNNLIYNNYLNNSYNIGFYGTKPGNIWNTTKTAGTNIIGGPYLGGNYWAKPDGTGFSQTHGGVGGICDSPYSIDVNNIDYLPLCLVTHNPYDENEDYVIDIGEVSAAIDDYRTQGSTSIADINELIDMYRSGVPYC